MADGTGCDDLQFQRPSAVSPPPLRPTSLLPPLGAFSPPHPHAPPPAVPRVAPPPFAKAVLAKREAAPAPSGPVVARRPPELRSLSGRALSSRTRNDLQTP